MRYAALALALLPSSVHARTATATGHATATVVAPLQAVAVRDLDFGTVAVAVAQGGSVVVSPGGGSAAQYGGSARQACLSGPDCAVPHPALFRVQGEEGRDYRIAIPATVQARPESGAGAALVVDQLTVRSASQPGAGAQGRLDPQGADSFEIGGTIRIPAGAEPARYRAQVEVLVTYG